MGNSASKRSKIIFISATKKVKVVEKRAAKNKPQGPHSHILLTRESEGLLWSEILAKRDFLGSMKNAGIVSVESRKKRRDIFGYCIFH